MINKDFGIKLKNGNKLYLEIDTNHPEKYSTPSNLRKMCLSAQD